MLPNESVGRRMNFMIDNIQRRLPRRHIQKMDENMNMALRVKIIIRREYVNL